MVSIKQEIKDELYTEEDYVHWDSDLSSDDEGDSRKKVDRLSTLSLKTIFSRRCLGKVPRKLRKLKTEKFDLFNDFDLSGDINNIISNLGDDAASCDSDSLLEKDSDRRIVNSDFDSVFNTGNDNADSGNNFHSKNDEVKTSDGDKNDESHNRSKDNISMGSETDASIDEDNNKSITSKKDSQNDITESSIEKEKSNDIEDADSKTQEPAPNNAEVTNTNQNESSEPKDTETDNKKESETKIADTSQIENKSEPTETENTKEATDNTVNNTDISNAPNQNGNIEDSIVNNDNGLNKSAGFDKVNGESGKCSDLETVRLMEEIDAQIDGGYIKKCDEKSNALDNVGDNKSLGMESISDEEFNFDA